MKKLVCERLGDVNSEKFTLTVSRFFMFLGLNFSEGSVFLFGLEDEEQEKEVRLEVISCAPGQDFDDSPLEGWLWGGSYSYMEPTDFSTLEDRFDEEAINKMIFQSNMRAVFYRLNMIDEDNYEE